MDSPFVKYPLYLFILLSTLVIYAGALWLFRKTKLSFLHPLLTSVIVIISLLVATSFPVTEYLNATKPIDFLLGPTVVALGFALYEQSQQLKQNLWSIIVSMFVGAAVGILSVVGVLALFNSPPDIVASMIPKSVTNPIAIPICENLGGISGLTSVVVVATGIIGALIGPFVLSRFGITSKIAQGLALGSAAHGVGTARAMEIGAIEGAIAGLAIGAMGLSTAILVPIFTLIL